MDKDVFGIWTLRNAKLTGAYQYPSVKSSPWIPDDLVPYTKRRTISNPEKFALHFYEHDFKFDASTRSKIKTYENLEIFRKYQSVILPDFSLLRDMPLYMQIDQVGRSRAFGNFLMHEGIDIIPNIRWGKENSYDFAFDGVDQHKIVAVGALGSGKNKENLRYFEQGFCKMLDVLKPSFLIIYGRISDRLKNACRMADSGFREYNTEKSKIHEKKKLISSSISPMLFDVNPGPNQMKSILGNFFPRRE